MRSCSSLIGTEDVATVIGNLPEVRAEAASPFASGGSQPTATLPDGNNQTERSVNTVLSAVRVTRISETSGPADLRTSGHCPGDLRPLLPDLTISSVALIKRLGIPT